MSLKLRTRKLDPAFQAPQKNEGRGEKTAGLKEETKGDDTRSGKQQKLKELGDKMREIDALNFKRKQDD